jgi:asparagine synthase (glutamine-hydrolysing)
VLELIAGDEARSAEIYDLAEVRRLVDEHQEIVRSGRPVDNHMMFLWQLVNLELWLRWLDKA